LGCDHVNLQLRAAQHVACASCSRFVALPALSLSIPIFASKRKHNLSKGVEEQHIAGIRRSCSNKLTSCNPLVFFMLQPPPKHVLPAAGYVLQAICCTWLRDSTCC